MANIKFSAFTTETNQSNIDFIVGYQGTTMKKIAPSNLGGASGTGTTGAITKWNDGPNGVLGDSIMVENATQVDLTGEFVCSSSPTAVAGPISALRANQATTTNGAFNIALYGDTKHTGATGANSNYGIYTKAEFEGTGGFTGIILGGYFEGRYDGSGVNGANASLYGTFAKARVTAPSSGDIQYMIANNVTSAMDAGTTTDVEFLQGQHTNVTFNSGNVSGDIAVELLDFDYTAGTLQGDFAYIQIQNDTVPTPVTGTARAINVDSTLPSRFAGNIIIEGDLGVGTTTTPNFNLDVIGDANFGNVTSFQDTIVINNDITDTTGTAGQIGKVLAAKNAGVEWVDGYNSFQTFVWTNGSPVAYTNWLSATASYLPFDATPLIESTNLPSGTTISNYLWTCTNAIGGTAGQVATFTLGANGAGTWKIRTCQHWFDQTNQVEMRVSLEGTATGGAKIDIIDQKSTELSGDKIFYGELVQACGAGDTIQVEVEFTAGGVNPFPSASGNRPIEITFERII